MPAYDFPASPTTGQKYTPVGGATYTFDGVLWKGDLAPTASAAPPVVTAYNPASTYAANDIVVNSGVLYRAKAAVPAGAWNAAQWEAFARLNSVQGWTKAQQGTPVAGTGAFDFSLSNNFTVPGAGAAVTIANPTNAIAGQSGVIDIDNAVTVAFGSAFKFEDNKAPTGSGAGKKDALVYYVRSATEIIAKLMKGV